MRVLGISGSTRKGNTEAMVEKALEGAKEAGALTEHVKLRELKIDPCCGEDECWHTEMCSSDKDELTEVFKKIREADALILGSPNYFNNVSWLFKIFIDRTNPYSKFKRLGGKKVALIVAGGYSDEANKKAEDYLREFSRIHGWQVSGSVRGHVEKPQDAEKDEKLMKKCLELGKKLME